MRSLYQNYQLFGLALFGGLFLSGYSAAGQQVSDQPLNTKPAPVAPSGKHGGFTAALSYSNNSSFFGRSQATRYPYMAGELVYRSRFGVWGSVMSYNLFDTSTFVDETDFSVGWDRDLSKTVDASISYSRFVFPATSPLVKSSVNNSVDGYVGWDWQYVYSRLNATYLFGESSDYVLTLDNSRNFEIDRVFTPKGYLSIVPRLSMTAGTQRFVATSIEQQELLGNTTAKSKKPKGNPNGNGNGNPNGNGNGNGNPNGNGNGNGNPNGNGNGNGNGNPNGNGNGNGNPNGNGNGTGTTTTVTTILTSSSTRFQILTYELRIPVTYSLGMFSAQVAWRYAIPVNLLPDDVSGPRSFLSTSLSLNL